MTFIEKVPEIKKPSLDSLLNSTEDNIKEQTEVLVEWIPQMEETCEKHNTAFTMFCESDKWFGSLIEKYNLVSDTVN